MHCDLLLGWVLVFIWGCCIQRVILQMYTEHAWICYCGNGSLCICGVALLYVFNGLHGLFPSA